MALVIVLAVWSVEAAPCFATPAGEARPTAEAAPGPAGGWESIQLYFFFAETCPHCMSAKAFLPSLRNGRPWLAIELHSVLERGGEDLFVEMMTGLGAAPEVVPTFVFCGTAHVGFDGQWTTGVALAEAIDRCHRARMAAAREGDASATTDEGMRETETVDVPFIGPVAMRSLSLPVLTVLLGGLDAFNPCAFFVLLFLLSLLVNARSRVKMALVGGVFVIVSGLMYFLFMAAWLKLFLVLENVGWITRLAGLVAVVIGALGVKDFYLIRRGPSLSISDADKGSLYARARGLLSAEHTATLLAGAGLLAIAANMYELICTSGFPLVFTRILTLHDLRPLERYGYLALYNIVYVVPLFVIVTVFVLTMGRRKLSEREGRNLKLVSGLVMLTMGTALLFAPGLMQNALFTVVILAGALVLTIGLSLSCSEEGDERPDT